jgi:hypothetical protein
MRSKVGALYWAPILTPGVMTPANSRKRLHVMEFTAQ